MSSVIAWAGVGFVLGFFVLLGLFKAFSPNGPDHGLWFVFSLMGAIPVAAIFAFFVAVKTILNELRETRREMKHWQSTFQMVDDDDKPSTQFKPGPPPRRD